MDLTKKEVYQDKGYQRKLEQLTSAWSVTYQAIESDLNFLCGGSNMYDSVVYNARRQYSMPILAVNLTSPYVDRIVAPIRSHPPGMGVRCKNNKLQKGINGVLRGIERASSATDAYAQALTQSSAGGLGWLRLAVEEDRQGLPVLRIRSVPNFASIYIDPCSICIDGSDARYAVHHGYMDKDLAKELYGEEATKKQNLGAVVGYSIPDSAVIDCTWYELENGGLRITRTVGTKEVFNEFYENVGYLPIVPVKGEQLFNRDSQRSLGGIVNKTRDLNQSINLTASNIMMLVSMAPKSPWIVAKEAVNGHQQTWATMNTDPHAYVMWNHMDKDGQPIPAPMRLDNSPQTQALQTTAEWLQSLLGRTTGITDAMLGGLESAGESGKALIARMEASESATAMYIDHLTSSITQLTRVCIELIPHVYKGVRKISIVDDHGRSSQETVDLSQIITPEVIDELEAQVESGPSMELQRKVATQALETMIGQAGDKGALFLDLWAENQNLPNQEDVIKRIKKLLPPELSQEEELDENGNPVQEQIDPRAQQALMSAQEALQMKDQTIDQLMAQMAQLQQQVNSQQELINADLTKTQMLIQKDLTIKQMDIDSKRTDLIIKTSAEEEKQVNQFKADLAKANHQALINDHDVHTNLNIDVNKAPPVIPEYMRSREQKSDELMHEISETPKEEIKEHKQNLEVKD